MILLLAAAGGALGCENQGDDAGEGGARPGALRVPELPPVPQPPSFPGDPLTPTKLALGTYLFFDKRLSGSGQTSCNSCHTYTTAFQDNLPLSSPDRSVPSDEPLLTRNTPSLLNIVHATVFHWDGSSTDLEQVMAFPFAEPNMNVAKLPAGSELIDVSSAQVALYHKLTVELPGYRQVYQDAFGVDIGTLDAITVWSLTGRALRAFVTQAISANAPFDRWNAGDDTVLDPSAVRGVEFFRGSGRCITCHGGPLLSDFGFHNLSTAWRADGTRDDEGRFSVTGLEADRGKFLTPTLRQAYSTSPYFHAGSHANLRSVLDHLSSASVTADPNHDPVFDTPPTLSEGDKDDLVAFLSALRAPVSAAITPPATFP